MMGRDASRLRALRPALIGAAAALLLGCGPQTRTELVRVEDQLRHLLELHTCEHVYRNLVYFGDERSFLFLRTVDRSVLFSVRIRVRAGLRLTRGVTLTADRHAADRIYVRLPPAELLSVDADETSIRQYFVRELGGRISLLDVSSQLELAKQRTADDAVARGILRAAEENAKSIIRSFLGLAGYSEVLFTTEERDGELRG